MTQDQRECYNSGYQDGYRDAVDELTDKFNKIIKDINKTICGE